MTGILIRRENLDTQIDTRDVHKRRKEHVQTQSICKPIREASEETRGVWLWQPWQTKTEPKSPCNPTTNRQIALHQN